MEISQVYKKVVELEGLLLLLDTQDIEKAKADFILTQLFEKVGEIDEELLSIRQQIIINNNYKTGISCEPSESGCGEKEMLTQKDLTDEIEEFESSATTEVENSFQTSPSCEIEEASELEEISDSAVFEQKTDADEASEEQVLEVPGMTTNDVADVKEEQLSYNDELPADINKADINKSVYVLKANGDIRKLFTINDNYKFRRQLFGNSQQNYIQALDYIQKLKSAQAAEDYIINSLNLDKENEDVKDFLAIVSTFFLSK